MQNFEYQNPVKILFGRGQIARLAEEIPAEARILMTYGGGSIKRTGVYDQVRSALAGREVREFDGIEPNPLYETLMRAVATVHEQRIEFLLAVGGGSVLDGSKFVAAAARFDGEPWDILKGAPVKAAVPLGCVLTLPATGSEMNPVAVISRKDSAEKLLFSSPHVFPKFSVLDPETTFSLPKHQIANGIVDAYAHVLEQYLTYEVNSPLQDRMAEGILLTLIREGPRTLADPLDYEARANFMWCATLALNGLIACGVPQDWSTHLMGHELTALYGLDHAETLAMIFPAALSARREGKREKLLQYAERVWDIRDGSPEQRIDRAIACTRQFFESLGERTHLAEYDIGPEAAGAVADRFEKRGWAGLGERHDLDPELVRKILTACA